jgi:hypothetical protein
MPWLAAWLLALCLQATPAHAQLPRTFISANGSDQNTCGRLTPCRTLLGAYAKTNIGGEINMLDPAGYGTLTITHSISIVNDGVGSAGILVGSGEVGITIAAGPDDEINLRGLIIEGAGLGKSGLVFKTGKSLTLQNCVVRNMSAFGIAFLPTGSSKLSISDCFVMDNGFEGILISTQEGGSTVATFNRVESSNNAAGFYIGGANSTGSTAATATNCIAVGNADAGFKLHGGDSQARLTVVDSLSAYNALGIHSNGSDARIRIGGTTVTGNGAGWTIVAGGVIESYGDNFVHGNTNFEAAMTPISPK